jgi:anti-anti-sigma factor
VLGGIAVQVMGLRANVTSGHDTLVISLDGEMDAATCEDVRSVLDRVEWGTTSRVAVDLRRVAFMDSTGLAMLIDLQHRADDHATSLVLVSGPPLVERVFDLTRTMGQFSWIEGSEIDHGAAAVD